MRAYEHAVSVLGLGAMGRALASVLLESGRRTTVWNRSAGRGDVLVAGGATEAASVREAVAASPLIVVCVRDYASARELLEPEVATLRGRSVVNLTTGTPQQARSMAEWAAAHDIGYLDGGIMATPDLIGGEHAFLLYSGSASVFGDRRDVLRLFGAERFMGDDAGAASLVDLALLASMYSLFVGFYQAAAMVTPAGMKATELAELVVPWLQAMMTSLPAQAAIIDSGDYATDVQDLRFTGAALDTIIAASREQGAGASVLEAIGGLIGRQIADGHGDQVFTRIYEGIKQS